MIRDCLLTISVIVICFINQAGKTKI